MWMREKLVTTLRMKSGVVFDNTFYRKAVAISNIKQEDFLTGSYRCSNIEIKVCFAQRPGP